MAKERALRVDLPGPDAERLAWRRVVVFAGVGLVLGVAWPIVAGVRIGPQVPGAKTATPSSSSNAPPPPAALSAPSAGAEAPALAAPTPAASVSKEQTVVVADGAVTLCWNKEKRIEPEHCGPLKADRLFVSRLQALKTCPSALGLAGEMGLGFDVDFAKKEIQVRKVGDSDLPSTTINGIVACVGDYIADVSPETIAHKYSKYRVTYTVKFYPPGTAPAAEGSEDEAPADDDAERRGLATVTWDTALLRDEPRTGKVIARLVRGTAVKILSRRKDWYRVTIQSKEGWVYRGALGL
jgi:hypothetical protein